MLTKDKSGNIIVNKGQVIQRWLEFYVEKFDNGEEDNYDYSQDEDLLDMVHTAEPLSDVKVEIAIDRVKNGKAADLNGN